MAKRIRVGDVVKLRNGKKLHVVSNLLPGARATIDGGDGKIVLRLQSLVTLHSANLPADLDFTALLSNKLIDILDSIGDEIAERHRIRIDGLQESNAQFAGVLAYCVHEDDRATSMEVRFYDYKFQAFDGTAEEFLDQVFAEAVGNV